MYRAKGYFKSNIRGITLDIKPDEEEVKHPKKKKGTLWQKEGREANFEEPIDKIEDSDWKMYRESLCVLAKIARVEGNMKDLYEIAMISMATGPCSEICLEVGIGYYEAKDYINAKNWLNIASAHTSPIMDPDAGSVKPAKYLKLINQ